MATGITVSVGASITSTMNNTTSPAAPAGANALDSNPADAYSDSITASLTFGAGTDKAHGHFHGVYDVAAAAQIIFDMTGAMTDVFGTAIAATEVKAIYIKNNNTVAGDALQLFGDVAAVWQQVPITLANGDALILGPKSFICLSNPIDGYAVGAGATDRIEVANAGGNSVEFEIFIAYEHA